MVSPESISASLVDRYSADVKRQMRRASPGGESDAGIFGILRYHLGWQDIHGNPADEGAGKGLRAVLVLASCEFAGGDWRSALPAAAAIELIHNFSLIHDDIQDRDETRRGRATAWTVFGVHEAVAGGNAMRVAGGQTIRALAETGLPAHTVLAAADVLTARYLEMVEGQYLDMSFEDSDGVTTDAYIDMISRKTGALVDCAMYIGALAATGDPQTAEAFGACGRRLGIAFQVRDDLLGIWGDPAATGKAVGADIRRKKKSMPIVYLFQKASTEQREWLRAAYSAEEVAPDDIERVLGLLAELDGEARVQQTAEDQAAGALSALDGVALAPGARERIQALADFFITRDK